MSKKLKQQRKLEAEKQKAIEDASPHVKMKFSADQFYVRAESKEADLASPLYEAGKVYEIHPSMVARWLKRGGVIVGDNQLGTKVEDKGLQKEDESPELDADLEEPVEGSDEKVEDQE